MVRSRGLFRILKICALAVLPMLAIGAPFGSPVAASSKARTKAPVVPLLDRELFFGNPEITGARLSPDGKYMAFLKPWKETRNIWVKKTGEPNSAAKLVTAEPKRPIPSFFWSQDSKVILFVKDKDGDENFNVWAVDPGQKTPVARNLTDAKGARASIYSVPKTEPDSIYVGLNDRDAAWHDLYKVKISTGQRVLLRRNTEKVDDWIFDRKGQLRLASRTLPNGDTEILRVDLDGLTPIYSCGALETCDVVGFHKDGKRIFLESNKGNRDLTQLVLLDPVNGKEELVESDPLGRVDFGYAIFSDLTEELLATTYQDERTRIYFRDKAFESDYKLLQRKLPAQDLDLVSMTRDERLCLILAHSDVDPGACYRFDRRTKQLSREYIVRERLPRKDMASMKPISYPSSDGLKIPAYLTIPKGAAAKNLPLIVLPHGGPWGRDTWGFKNGVQFLANRGYAVLQPNFRGSTGYGKKFLNAGNKQWGDRMQDDLTWGVKYLVQQGIADPKRVGIMGGSYGGYATLAGVAFTPDLYQAAVSIVGPSNLITLLDTIPPYWESLRITFYERMGNPATPEGKQQLERQSPLNSASHIKTPLLVVQGANDPRVKKAESEQIVVALRDRGFPVEYLCAPDEGHGFMRPVNNLALYAAAEHFLAKHLKGRFQEGGSPEVLQRLSEITVDPKTVVVGGKQGASSDAPKVVSDLVAGTSVFKGTLQMMGQTMPLTLKSVVKEEGDTWVVTETAQMPMGDGIDTTVLKKGTLEVLKHSVNQFPFVTEAVYKDGKVTGRSALGDEVKNISEPTKGVIFAEGAGAQEVLARLPLAAGFSTTFRNYDAQNQKLSLKQAKVTGIEEVKVALGTCKAWKLEITSVDGEPGGTTLWIDTTTRKPVKMSANLAQMGGALLSLELQP